MRKNSCPAIEYMMFGYMREPTNEIEEDEPNYFEDDQD